MSTVEMNRPIGIMGAMSEEIVLIKEQLLDIKEIKKGDITFYTGTIAGKAIVLSLSGIGIVNSSITSTILIETFKVQAIIFTGVSGSISSQLTLGDIIVGTDFINHGVDHTPFGMLPGQIAPEDEFRFPADKKLLELATNVSKRILPKQKIMNGRVISADIFVVNKEMKIELAKSFEAYAVDMESAPVAQTAYKFGIPVVIIRAISDDSGDEGKEQYEQFFKNVAKNSANIVLTMLAEEDFPYTK